MGIVPVAAHHDLRARSVVREEQYEGVLERAHRAELVEHPADLLIHAVDHRGVDRHLRGLEPALNLGEPFPRNRPVQFALAQLRDGVGECIGRAEILVERRQGPDLQTQLPLAYVPFLPQPIPANKIPVFVARDVIGFGMQRKVGRVEREVLEEWPVGIPGRVLSQAFDRVIRRDPGEIAAALGFHIGKPLAIPDLADQVEEPGAIADLVGVIESVVQGVAVNMPLAGVIGPVARLTQPVRYEAGPWRPLAAAAEGAAISSRHAIAADLLRIVAGEESRASRPAARSVVELREPQPSLG